MLLKLMKPLENLIPLVYPLRQEHGIFVGVFSLSGVFTPHRYFYAENTVEMDKWITLFSNNKQMWLYCIYNGYYVLKK